MAASNNRCAAAADVEKAVGVGGVLANRAQVIARRGVGLRVQPSFGEVEPVCAELEAP